jgi:hypothetical protein
MNKEFLRQAKSIIIKTLERRNAVTERELLDIPEMAKLAKEKGLKPLLAELIENKDIMFLEFAHEDRPGTVHTIYFPNGTMIYEPGLSIASRITPDDVQDFFENMLKRGIVEQEFVDALDREGKITYYDAIQAHVQSAGIPARKLDKPTTARILERLVIEGKVALIGNHDLWTPESGGTS